MGFFALVLALLVEHTWPLRRGNRVHVEAAGFAAAIRQAFDGGEHRHGVFGWLIVVGATVLLVAGLEWLARSIHPLAVFALHVLVLYLTIGFRQFSHAFAEIRIALAADDAEGARAVLAGWLRGANPVEEAIAARRPDVEETCRQSIAHALLAAHRHVLGPLFCYIVVPGALGPVLYRMAEMLARHWQPLAAQGLGRRPGAEPERAALDASGDRPAFAGAARPTGAGELAEPLDPWGRFADRAFAVIDWLPSRLSAIGFAIVGNFDDALYCWRGASAALAGAAQAGPTQVGQAQPGPSQSGQSQRLADETRALLMAVGSGALGVRLADPVLERRWAASARPFECPGGDAQPATLPLAATLVWRSLLLWLGLYALITVSAWMGG